MCIRDSTRVVHGQQTFVHHRPLTAGDAVVGVLHVDAVKVVAGNAMVTTRTELTVDAVSYTHLDVYKRQRPQRTHDSEDGRVCDADPTGAQVPDRGGECAEPDDDQR